MQNRIGFHMNYFRGTRYEYDPIGVLDRLCGAGLSAIEVMPAHLYKLSQSELSRFRDMIAERDVELICGAGRSPETDASSPDPAVREASYAHSLKTMTLLHELGGHKWDGLIHAAWPGSPKGTLTAEAKREIMSRCAYEMRRLLPLAEELDIDLCFEAVNRFEHYLINSAEEGVAFCRELDHPRAKLLLDVFHMNIEEDDIGAAIASAAAANVLGHFHISEANRRVPGTGETHIDWDAVFDALLSSGYAGSVILEPFIVTGAPFSSTSCIWRDLSAGADDDGLFKFAADGMSFARKGLEAARARQR